MDLFWRRRSRTSHSIIHISLGESPQCKAWCISLSRDAEALPTPSSLSTQASVPALSVCLTSSLGLFKTFQGFHAFRKHFSNPISPPVAPFFFKVECNYSPHNPFCTVNQPCGTLKSHVKFWVSNYSTGLCSLFLTKTHLLGSMTLFPIAFESLNRN